MESEKHQTIESMKEAIESISTKYNAEPVLFSTIELLMEAMFYKKRDVAINNVFCVLHAAMDIYYEEAESSEFSFEYCEYADVISDIISDFADRRHSLSQKPP